MFYVSDQQQHVIPSRWGCFRPAIRAGGNCRHPGPSTTSLDLPEYVQAPDGRLIVADRGHHRLWWVSVDGSKAELLAPDDLVAWI